jgi:hypothetical protein
VNESGSKWQLFCRDYSLEGKINTIIQKQEKGTDRDVQGRRSHFHISSSSNGLTFKQRPEVKDLK